MFIEDGDDHGGGNDYRGESMVIMMIIKKKINAITVRYI